MSLIGSTRTSHDVSFRAAIRGTADLQRFFQMNNPSERETQIFFGVSLDSEIALDACGLITVDRSPARIVLLPRDISFLGCLAISKQSAGKRCSMTTCLRVLEGRFTSGRFQVMGRPRRLCGL
jgi:hypothetical protein